VKPDSGEGLLRPVVRVGGRTASGTLLQVKLAWV